jgi:ribosomal protein S27E
LSRIADSVGFGENMQKNPGKPKVKCKNCEGKGLLKKGDKKVKCQRCGGIISNATCPLLAPSGLAEIARECLLSG